MKNIIKALLVVVVLCVALTACDFQGTVDQIKNTVIGTFNDVKCTVSGGHVYELHAEEPATCTEDGLSAGELCVTCGHAKRQRFVIPAKGHKMAAATCTEPSTCTVCGHTEGEANGHTEAPYDKVEATCVKAGHEAGVACSVCKENLSGGEEIPATGVHTPVDFEGKDPTCTEEGYTAGKYCEVCEAILEGGETIPVKHTYTTFVTTAPTAEAAGSTTATCECGHSVTYANVSAMAPGTYVLEGADLAGIKQYDLFDGEVVVVKDVFELHLSGKYATNEGQNKTFADEYFGEVRLNYGGKTEFKEGGLIKNGIVFTTTGPTTIKVWWVSGGDGRYIGIYDLQGNLVAQTNEATVKNDPYIAEFTLPAGTYVIGNVTNTNYHFKVEVTVAEPKKDPVLTHKADFNTIVTEKEFGDSSYSKTFTTTEGWVVTNSAIQTGKASDPAANPQFPVVGPDNSHKAVCLNGKKTAVGTLTSPTLTGGLSKLTMKYTKMFTDTVLSVTIKVTDLTTGAVYTQVVEREVHKDNDKYVVWDYEWVLETAIEGDYTIEIVNNCPSNSTSNKDRITILSLECYN